MERRDFLKGSCRICLFGAAATFAAGLASCSPKITGTTDSFRPVMINNQVSVPLTLFEHQAFLVISPAKFEYEIAVEKKADNYTALLMKCTHFENQLTSTGIGYNCSLHGSRFDKEGNVIKGPAARPLQQLKTHILNNNLIIQIIS